MYSLKTLNIRLSCNIEKSAKNAAGIFGFFYVIAFECVLIQHPAPEFVHGDDCGMNNKLIKFAI